MIINIRGTSGSGKSTLVRKIMKKFSAEPIVDKKTGKVTDYYMDTPYGPLYVIGRYETACGGCDGIKTQDEVRARVRKYAKKGHVVFEGLIVTSCYGKYLNLFKRLKQPFMFVFLSTKIETCIKMVEKRRRAKGNMKPLDPTNTIAKMKIVERTIERCREDNTPHIVVSRNRALEEILCLLEQHPFQNTRK